MSDMPSVLCARMTEEELLADGEWERIRREAFPPEELEPIEVVLRSIRVGVGMAVRAQIEEQTVGLAALHLLEKIPIGYLTYLATEKDRRGQSGIGTALLASAAAFSTQELGNKSLISRGLIWEVDDPAVAAEDEAEKRKRERRIGFFRRNGGVLLDIPYLQPPVNPELGPVPMKLMVRPDDQAIPSIDDQWRMVRQMYDRKYRDTNGISAEILANLWSTIRLNADEPPPARR